MTQRTGAKDGDSPCPPLVIGLGNRDCGDDGAGPLVARLLRDRVAPGIRIEEQDGAAAELIERLRDADSVFLIDAAMSGAPAGTIHAIDCTSETAALPTRSAASSHGLGVAEAIALARVLYGLPRVCRLYAVEGVAFAPGAAMSHPVRAAAEQLAARLADEVSSG